MDTEKRWGEETYQQLLGVPFFPRTAVYSGFSLPMGSSLDSSACHPRLP